MVRSIATCPSPRRSPVRLLASTTVAVVALGLVGTLGQAPADAVSKPTTTTAVPAPSAAANPADRIPGDYSKLAPAVIARRAIGAMKGDHTVDAKLTLGDDPEPHVVKGHIDPGTGDAKITYLHIVADDPTSRTSSEIRIHDGIGYGAVAADLRGDLLVDWYRYDLTDKTLSPSSIIVGSLITKSPSGAATVTSWRQNLVTTFGPKTRHFTGTALAKDALPILDIESDTDKVKFELWVDSSGELRRLRWTMPATPSPDLSTLQMQADFRDRRKTLVVSAPLKNVVDLADLITPTGTV